MSKAKSVSVERLRDRLDVDFKSGRLYYKPIGLRGWDTQNSGKECFNIKCNNYLAGTIDKVRLYKHRVILAMYLGRWPNFVDHINGDTKDNRLSNLREVSQAENRKNCSLHKKNASGYNGITWSKESGKWLVRVCHNYKEYNLGLYKDLDEAIEVRRIADERYGFHPNHGRSRQGKV